ncbi:MAG: glycerophosphodiester phosphodiesterase [Paraglaciecola sp.]|uniref:glycerophosphodiester phosphodiesterase n=1 Tax=Paraglaciecola sp. TaxID=1920173 RepID=UPI00273E444D|nr:glycerophosphodiester phosphodiesterase family protein [Paraglaciecola sp.]MDP5031510.1 glycerophosphodiester phosphodiesterase [Paraglaciecola sp.]MDP5133311.1 glycerophosphodiester phosphodiesterase [Paraglaciecola sp.]
MQIFAHRGASAEAPENTLLAIAKALEYQVDGIEIDVHQIGQELVVIHDRWVQRTTNGKGLVANLDFKQLRSFDAGLGQQVPTLWEVMILVAGQCNLNIEIKGLQDTSILFSIMAKAEQELGFTTEQLIVSSFDHHLLSQIKTLKPETQIGALTASKPIKYAEFAAELGAFSVNADMAFLDEAFVLDAHRRGLKVFVYTVDEPEDLAQLYRWNVDGVFCNKPRAAKNYIRSISSQK